MNVKAIFIPLKDKKSLKIFFIAIIVIALIYFAISVILSLLTIRPIPDGGIINILLFAMFRGFSGFFIRDWIIFALFPIVGALLFANYSYWKCKSNKFGSTGLVVGVLAATCPACILPIIGITSFITVLTKISLYIKIAALLLIVGATVYVANKNCEIKTE